MGSPLTIGIDAGGTKTHVLIARGGDVVHDNVMPTSDWWPTTVPIEDPDNAQRLLDRLPLTAADRDSPGVLVLGAHGIDSTDQAVAVREALEARFPGVVRAENDAMLPGPAAGYLGAVVTVIAGTGSIVLGVDSHGSPTRRGGLGHLLGDEGSAPALVRDLARALMRGADRGTRDPAGEGALLRAVGIAEGPDDLAQLATWLHAHSSRTDWGALAPAVFEAADAGSPTAEQVIGRHAEELGGLVVSMVSAGLDADAVVLAGGVVVHQPRLAAAIGQAVHAHVTGIPVVVLDRPPAFGALALARAVAASLDHLTAQPPQPPHTTTTNEGNHR